MRRSTGKIRMMIGSQKIGWRPAALTLAWTLALLTLPIWLSAEPTTEKSSAMENSPEDPALTEYFKTETAELSKDCLSGIHSLKDWQAERNELRREAAEMLGLDPLPERTDLKPVVTGTLDGGTFTVEKLYFQSRPHLYVTANLYLPKQITKPVPAILYLCGHTQVETNGVSYGNKTAYQHHAVWFARNGYACLIIDTLQYGEIEGHHAGTFSEGAWWWNSRGYTPAGVETWDALRALDYLISRPEVDASRIGVTGRSGGGAYSWFLAVLDDRVKVIAPVAGITDLQNYLVDGTVDDHCDCMFLVNTYRWDYPMLAALSAPRPLLLVNTDTDAHFPLSGVMQTYGLVKRIYDLYQASTNFGLVIGPGPHADTQNLQVPVFRWFNHYLKQQDPLINEAAVKIFSPSQLKVFDKIPGDQINTAIESGFVPMASPPIVPSTADAWRKLRDQWMNDLREKCFAGWPANIPPLKTHRIFSEAADGVVYEAYDFQSQPSVTLRFYLLRPAGEVAPAQIFLRVAGSPTKSSGGASGVSPQIAETMKAFGTDGDVHSLMQNIKTGGAAYAVFRPRGVEALVAGSDEETHVRRRFMLLGQTLDGMRVWDIRRSVQALRSLAGFEQAPLQIHAEAAIGVDVLYASLFESGINRLDLRRIPASHMDKNSPDYLNVLKFLDIPEAAAMAAARCPLRLQPAASAGWEFLNAMAESGAANLKLEMIK
jgi:dienelactone hydrolase